VPEPAVTVIIPAYQSGRFIEASIASVVAQTTDSWECIVVDDGSTDDAADRVRTLAERDARVRYLVQDRRGPSAARNAGLQAARGEFVQFLDADDRIAPKKLERQRALLEADPSLDLVYGDAVYFDDEHPERLRGTLGAADRVALQGLSGRGQALVASLLRGNVMVVEAPLVRRRLLEAVGGFDEAQRYVEDWDLWLRGARSGASFQFDPGEAGRSFVRVHPASASVDRRAMLRAELAMRRRLEGRLSDPSLEELNSFGIASADAALLILEAPSGRLRDEVRRMARAALRWRRWRWGLWVLALPLLRIRLGRTAVEMVRRSMRAKRMA
jgi:glycosyltransferase involved in cell wall biosynthesis